MTNREDILYQRLHNQLLVVGKSDSSKSKPSDVVSWLGAVQAQDYNASKWALGLRIKDSKDEDIEKAFNDGAILRTHIMRPTWHFIVPEDIRWMLELTAPRVKKLLAHYDRKLELDDNVLARCGEIIAKALENNNYLTRAEIGDHLEKSGILARGQRLGHIVLYSELNALICSGPRKGKKITYALLEERVPKFKKISREESLANLASRYFTSHGPAQIKDFSWWSGLSMKDASEGLDFIKSKLIHEMLDDKTYWFSAVSLSSKAKIPKALLLSIFDEYVIAYKDRSALSGERYVEKLLGMGNALTSVLVIDGAIAGTWKRVVKKDSVAVLVSPLRDLSDLERDAITICANHYAEFLGVSAISVEYIK